MKKCIGLFAICLSFGLFFGTTHAQTSQTTITSITVPGSVSPDLVQKVTKVAPAIMSAIDNKWWYGSPMYNAYMTALAAYAAKFNAEWDAKKEWIANTLIAYAQAYYDEKGKEVTVVEVPVVKPVVEEPAVDPSEIAPTQVVAKDYASQQEELDDMRALWKAQFLRNYKMVQQLGCFCTEDFTRPVVFDVENGRVEQRTANYYNGARESVQTLNGPILITIEGYFDLIEDAINSNVASLEVEYHPQKGYPTTINIDYNELIADEEKYYTIKVF